MNRLQLCVLMLSALFVSVSAQSTPNKLAIQDIFNIHHAYPGDDFSVVKNVKTPTMVLTGEEDWRTPMSDSEQYYQALKLLGVESVLIRVPDEPHGIQVRPSHHMSKVLHIIGWFDKYRKSEGAGSGN